MATETSASVPLDDAQATWATYFDAADDVALPSGDVFRTYRAGTRGPHVVLLHGGGYTSMTWCLVSSLLRTGFIVHAIDLRGHGATHTADDSDLSITTLVNDVVAVLAHILPPDTEASATTAAAADANNAPQTILVGHSLGGAVAVRVAATNRIPSLVGVMVIDVVEGTALASLKHMHSILDKRPAQFLSYNDAIAWSLHSGTVRNADAARVSIPSQLQPTADANAFTWRTDLQASAPYWRDWFVGLSEQFLSLSVAKILVLAGSDRLDTSLVRAQMMGKFELKLLNGAGHVIQEDCPEQVATAIIEFAARCSRTLAGVAMPNVGAVGINARLAPPPANAVLAAKLAKARNMVPH